MPVKHEYRPARFYGWTFLVSWSCMLGQALLQGKPGIEGLVLVLNLVALLGPLIVALVMIFGSGDPVLKKDFRDRFLDPRRLNPRYLLISIVLPFAVTFLSIGISLLVGQSRDQLALAGNTGLIVLALILAPIIEELGWRGYGVDSLRAKLGMLSASVAFGLLWSLWHAPLALINGTYHNELARMDSPIYLANFFVSVVPLAVVANWIYYRQNRSILGNILFHSMANGAAVLVNATQVTKCIVTLVYLAIAVGLVVFDRAGFRQGPRNYLDYGKAGSPNG